MGVRCGGARAIEGGVTGKQRSGRTKRSALSVHKGELALPAGTEVEMVSTPDQLDSAISELTRLSEKSSLHESSASAACKTPVLGIDCEWRPGSNPVALLQLATREVVYLIDVLECKCNQSVRSKLTKLCSEIVYTHASIPKVGLGLGSDLHKLAHDWPTLQLKQLEWHSVVDIRSVVDRCRPDLIRQARSRGLSALCEAVLGKSLNKEMQVSDWDFRPLSHAQIEYAALDARVAVMLWDELVPHQPEMIQELETLAISPSSAMASVNAGSGGGKRRRRKHQVESFAAPACASSATASDQPAQASQLRRRLRGVPSTNVDFDLDTILSKTGQVLPERAYGRGKLFNYAKTGMPVKASGSGSLEFQNCVLLLINTKGSGQYRNEIWADAQGYFRVNWNLTEPFKSGGKSPANGLASPLPSLGFRLAGNDNNELEFDRSMGTTAVLLVRGENVPYTSFGTLTLVSWKWYVQQHGFMSRRTRAKARAMLETVWRLDDSKTIDRCFDSRKLAEALRTDGCVTKQMRTIRGLSQEAEGRSEVDSATEP